MKKIYRDKILNIEGTDMYDQIFYLDYFTSLQACGDVEIIYMKDLLEQYKNEEIAEKVKEKPAMWSEMYSPKDELAIFTELFENVLKNKKKIHIVGVTLGEEVQMLEEYYKELGFMREDMNVFEVDFSVPLVTVSCHIENLMWKGSDYKAHRDKIFFCPPIRESGQNKALFKGITRGVIAGIDMSQKNLVEANLVEANLVEANLVFAQDKDEINGQTGEINGQTQGLPLRYEQFIGDCIRQEKILPLHMAKVLRYNLEDRGGEGELGDIKIEY